MEINFAELYTRAKHLCRPENLSLLGTRTLLQFVLPFDGYAAE
jgi:hypothetical protein